MARTFSASALLVAAAASVVVLGTGAREGWSAQVQSSKDCQDAMSKASIDSAYVVETGPPPEGQRALQTVALGQRIAVTVTGLADLKDKCTSIILFLNGYPIKSERPYPPTPPPAPPPPATTAGQNPPPPSPPPAGIAGQTRPNPPPGSGDLWFTLTVTDGSTATDGSKITDGSRDWTPILGRPPLPGNFKTLAVSVGVEDQYPLKASPGKSLPEFRFNPLHTGWFAVWGALFLGLLALFIFCALCSNIIREGTPADNYVPGAKGAYSLSKSQGAWWFFIILAAYLLIGIVTGDYLNSINSTALILLGIGAGTVIGSAAIDAAKRTPESILAERNKIVEIKARIDQLESDVKKLDVELAAQYKEIVDLKKQLSSTPDETKTLEGQLADKAKAQVITINQRVDKANELENALSSYRKLIGQSEDFFTDILSDANGVSFHRFQMAAFTLILGFVFIRGVYDNLAMPEFNQTLMGFLGLSAGTYLGLKIPEATTPKK
jgi:hypothetical protein